MSGVMVITGASRGIGAATALLAAERGYDLCINYVSNEQAARAVADKAERAGAKTVTVKGDVAEEADVARIFAAADGLGTLSALINNAGVVDIAQRVDEMSAGRLARMMNINVIGSFVCAREAVKRMSTRHGGKGGAIVNVSSAASWLGSPGQYVDYAASKGAVDVMTHGLALEVAAEGIRVNAVSPAIIDTDIHASGGIPDRVAQLRDTIPMKREGYAEEVARAILWLASDEASYTTGAVMPVSGGR